MYNGEISRAVRAARRPLRKERDAWRMVSICLLVASTVLNAALCGAIVHFDRLHETEVSAYQRDLEYAYAVRNHALQELGKATQLFEAEKLASHELEEAYDTISSYQYIGQCKITYYCLCSKCCGANSDGLTATGIPATTGIIAVDPDIIPLGSTVIINGQKYLAADTGSAVKGLHIDICVADHNTALSNGVSTADVWVVNE